MEWVLISCFVVSFAITFFIIPVWIRKARGMGLVGRDMNKPKRPLVAEAGGISVIIGSVTGILLYIFLATFYFSSTFGVIEIFAVLTTILLAGFVGFIDDILGWKTGMKQKYKVLSTLPIAIPLAVVNAGHSVLGVPFVGFVDFGVIFPLVIIPLGIIGATNGYNMLAGYNGLESGMGIIILLTMGAFAWLTGSSWVSMLSVTMACALLAFFWYNKPPAKVFPGDALTYSVGASIACVAVLGNMEKIALVLFIPYIFDALMFIRFRFFDSVKNVEAFAKVNNDGSLEMPHKKVYDFAHLSIWIAKKFRKRVYEKDVVVVIFAIEVLLAFLAFSLLQLKIL